MSLRPDDNLFRFSNIPRSTRLVITLLITVIIIAPPKMSFELFPVPTITYLLCCPYLSILLSSANQLLSLIVKLSYTSPSRYISSHPLSSHTPLICFRQSSSTLFLGQPSYITHSIVTSTLSYSPTCDSTAAPHSSYLTPVLVMPPSLHLAMATLLPVSKSSITCVARIYPSV